MTIVETDNAQNCQYIQQEFLDKLELFLDAGEILTSYWTEIENEKVLESINLNYPLKSSFCDLIADLKMFQDNFSDVHFEQIKIK